MSSLVDYCTCHCKILTIIPKRTFVVAKQAVGRLRTTGNAWRRREKRPEVIKEEGFPSPLKPHFSTDSLII